MGQLVLNSLIAAASCFLMAMAIGLTHRLLRFFDFALAGIVAVGAYVLYACTTWFGSPLMLGCVAAAGSAGILGLIIHTCFYRILCIRRSPPATLLLGSLGVWAVLQSLVALSFGSDVLVLPSEGVREGIWVLNMGRMTPPQIAILLVAIGIGLAMHVTLSCTRLGLRIRAAGEDSLLAEIAGIDTLRAAMLPAFLAGVLAGGVGSILAAEGAVRTTMGLTPFFMGAVTAVMAGKRLLSLALMALLLGVIQQLAARTGATEWQDAIVLGLLLTILVVRSWRTPQGLPHLQAG